MPERIPQSTTIRVPLQAYLASDHVSPATGKTIAITISKNGGAYGNPSGGATNATEIASGSYYVDLSTTDTGTLGPLFVLGTAASTDNVVAIYNIAKATNGGWTAVPDALPGAAGGLFIAGTNAPVTITGSGDALTLTSSGGNGNGINASGNGTGDGIKTTGGATGRGLHALGGATSGAGFRAEGQGAGASGMHALGFGASGSGFRMEAGSTTAPGLLAIGGTTSGPGVSITTTSGDGLSITPTAGNGIVATANGTSKHGAVITGGTAGTSDGLNAVAGTGGVPIRGDITGNITGSLSGSAGSVTGNVGGNVTGSVGSVVGAVGSVTGAVGSVTGNVGGNVVGTVASVVGAVGSVTGNVGGNVTGSVGSVVGAVGSVTGSVGGNVTGSVGSVATGGIAAASVAAAAADKIADHVRRRTQANVEASSDGDALSVHSEYGMIQQVQKSNTTAHAGKLTVYQTDGTTELAQETISVDATADPITGIS